MAKFTYRITLLIACSLLMLQTTQAQGQALGIEKFSGDVNLISDVQLNEFWSNAKKLGYDYTKLTELLREGGFSYSESIAIVERIRNMEMASSSDPFSVLQSLPDDNMTAFEKKIYGLKLFYQGNFALTEFQFMPTPSNYKLGVGDTLSVVVYGETDATYKLAIDRSGMTRLPFIGAFQLAGLSFEASKSVLRRKLGINHSGLLTSPPTDFIDVTLSNARSITVSLLGEVRNPGSYSIPSTASIFNALYRAGGPTINGTLRNIKVYRDNRLLTTIDLYDFINKGIMSKNIALSDQDVIVLDTYEKRVELVGGIKRPGIYEVKDNQSVGDIIDFAGGVTAAADTSNIMHRRKQGSEQFIKPIRRDFSIADIRDEDVIELPVLKDYNIERIQVSGAVNRPGFFDWREGISLSDLIERAGGLRKDAIQRASVFYVGDDLRPQLTSESLTNQSEGIKINKQTLIFIPSRLETRDTEFIKVSGSVNREGDFPFYNGMTLQDAIILAGGFKFSAIGGNMEVVRFDSTLQKNRYYQIDIPSDIQNVPTYELRHHDFIYVRDNDDRKNRTVFIRGDVKREGEYVINQGETTVLSLKKRFDSFLPTANLDGVKLYRLVSSIEDLSDSVEFERKQDLANFINDPRFSNSISSLEFEDINAAEQQMEVDRFLSLNKRAQQQSNEINESDSINSLNNFRLSKEFVIKDRPVRLLQIGLRFNEILEDSTSQYNVKILDGDILYVPSKSSLVEVDGGVFRPQQMIFRKELTFKDYIEGAGGYKRKGDRRRAYIEYANGEIKRVKTFLWFTTSYPEVKMDSRIIVPMKPEGTELNYERVIYLITTTLTTYLLVTSINSSN